MLKNGGKNMAKIIVDADACPVKSEIAEVAARYDTEVIMVASIDHHIPPRQGIQVVQVDRSAQSVDLHIANRVRPGDIVVTQDFGLAAIGLAKKAIVMSNRGQIYTDRTIDFLLASRHESAKQRRGGKRGKGPRSFTEEDRRRFSRALTKVLVNLQENLSF